MIRSRRIVWAAGLGCRRDREWPRARRRRSPHRLPPPQRRRRLRAPPRSRCRGSSWARASAPTSRSPPPTTTFGRRDTIYASVATEGAAPSKTLTAKWTFQDGQTVKEQAESIAPTGPAATEFHISKQGPWPVGKYKVEVRSTARRRAARTSRSSSGQLLDPQDGRRHLSVRAASCASAGPSGTASPTRSRSSISAAWPRATRPSSITQVTRRRWSAWRGSSPIRIPIPRPRTRRLDVVDIEAGDRLARPVTLAAGQGRSGIRGAGAGPHVATQRHSRAGGAVEAAAQDGVNEVGVAVGNVDEPAPLHVHSAGRWR